MGHKGGLGSWQVCLVGCPWNRNSSYGRQGRMPALLRSGVSHSSTSYDAMRLRALAVSVGIGVLSIGCLCLESCRTGVTLPRSETIIALQSRRPGLIYSLFGAERTPNGSVDERALVHVVILQPSGSPMGSNGSNLEYKCAQAVHIETWSQG